MRHVAIYTAFLLTGCSDLFPAEVEDLLPPTDTSASATQTTTATQTTPSVAFTLADTAIAGEAVPWSATLLDAEGAAISGLEWTIGSDIESVAATMDTLTATIAGTHTITLSTSHAGNEHSASALLDVAPAAVAELELEITPPVIKAGQEATWTLRVADAYGNEVPADEAAIGGEHLTVQDDRVGGTLAGVHTLTAALGGAEDSVALTVEAGAAASLDLNLIPASGLQPGDTAVADVALLDLHGNQTDEDWTLSATGGDVTIDEDEVTFNRDGIYIVTASSGDLNDSVGPVVVDGNAPNIVITEPSRGDFLPGPNVRVRGTVTDAVTNGPSFFVNGEDVSLNAYGAFDHTFYLPEPGIQTLVFQAYDDSGNVREAHRSVHLGDTVALGETAPNGLQVRMENDSGGLDALETLADGLVTD